MGEGSRGLDSLPRQEDRMRRMITRYHRFVVTTHLGEFETIATSPAKAVSNVRFRLFRGSAAGSQFVVGWTVKEKEK